MRLVSAVALLGALTVASATNCDEYSFCEDPGMTIIDGNYKFGQSYHDQTCLATTENAQSFRSVDNCSLSYSQCLPSYFVFHVAV